MMIRQYYKNADAGFESTIDIGVILTIRWVAIIGQGAALLLPICCYSLICHYCQHCL